MSHDAPTLAPRFGAGRFVLVAELGVRRTGGVFLAHDRKVGQRCALKLLDEGDVPEEAILRFLAEARDLEQLDHPHVVRARAHGRERGFSWYAMDLLRGGSLQDLAKKRVIPPVHALGLVFQVLVGLDALHRAGLVHRDVKLSNVLLDDGRAVLTDLGIAHHRRGGVPYDTHTGQELGTAGYVAPEQYEHAGSVGAPADLFSTGVVLYRMITRRPPHRIHLAHYRPDLLDEVPERLRPILLRATQVDVEARYPDARSMGEAVYDAARDVARDPSAVAGWLGQFDEPGGEEAFGALRAWLERD